MIKITVGSGRRLAVAALVAVVVAAPAAVAVAYGAKSLGVATRTVSGKSQKIVVDGRGVTVYELGGESLARLECITRTCFSVWQPLKAPSAGTKVTMGAGLTGTVSILHRVKGGFYQVMLSRHPLYYFAGDKGRSGSVKGQGITSFGGRWHVVSAG
jgi:predicted lipoprotein with Yx(FWY)xxD motif